MRAPRITDLPRGAIESLLLLASQADKLDAIVQAICKSDPTVSLAALARTVAHLNNLSSRVTLAVLEALDNLLRLIVDTGLGVTQVLELLSSAIGDASDASTLDLWEKSRPAIERAINQLGQGSSLTISSKAASLVLDEQNELLDARILTDVRPVFGQNSSLNAVHGVVVQHLMLDFVASGGPKQTLSIALGTKDIEKLLAACQRAQEKLVAASQLWSATGLPAPLTRE